MTSEVIIIPENTGISPSQREAGNARRRHTGRRGRDTTQRTQSGSSRPPKPKPVHKVKHILSGPERNGLVKYIPKDVSYLDKLPDNKHSLYTEVISYYCKNYHHILGFSRSLLHSRKVLIVPTGRVGDGLWKSMACAYAKSVKINISYTSISEYILYAEQQIAMGELVDSLICLPGEIEQLKTADICALVRGVREFCSLHVVPNGSISKHFCDSVTITTNGNRSEVRVDGLPKFCTYKNLEVDDKLAYYESRLGPDLVLRRWFIVDHNVTTEPIIPVMTKEDLPIAIHESTYFKKNITHDTQYFYYQQLGYQVRIPIKAVNKAIQLGNSKKFTDAETAILSKALGRFINQDDMENYEKLLAAREIEKWKGYIMDNFEKSKTKDNIALATWSHYLNNLKRNISLDALKHLETLVSKSLYIIAGAMLMLIILILNSFSIIMLPYALFLCVRVSAILMGVYSMVNFKNLSVRVRLLMVISFTVALLISPVLAILIFIGVVSPIIVIGLILVSGVSCGPFVDITITFALLFCFLLLFLGLIIDNKRGKYNVWNMYKRSVEEDRVTIPGSGPIPASNYIVDCETLIDHTKYPPNPGSMLQITEEIPRFERRPAIRAVGIVFDCKAPIVHSTSQFNLKRALQTRALCDVPGGLDGAWQLLDATTKDLLCQVQDCGGYPDYVGEEIEFHENGSQLSYKPHGKVTWEEYLSRFIPRKRVKLEQGRIKFQNVDPDSKDLYYETFIKREKIMSIGHLPFEPLRPRVIQGCSLASKVLAGPWFLNYSYALKGAWNILNDIWYCSGHIADDYSAWINKGIDEFGLEDCLFIGSDFSKYDVTQGEHCMKREVAWYKQLGFEKHVRCGRAILNLKRKYFGRGQGLVYSMVNTRKSGENDTSSGNSKNTAECVVTYLKLLETKFRMAVLGDDNYTIVSLRSLKISIESFIEGLRNWATILGYQLKVQFSIAKPHLVEFLSSRFYPVNDRWVFGKKPGRLLTKLGWMMNKHGRKDKEYREYFKGTLLSLRPVCNHIPFLGKAINIMLLALKDVQGKVDIEEQMYKQMNNGTICKPADDTYLAFEELYNLTPSDEEHFLKELKKCVNEMPYLMESHMVEYMCAIDDLM